MTPITSSAASETESARNLTPGRSGATAGDHGLAATVGQVDVEQDDLRIQLADQRHGLGDAARLADDLDGVGKLVAHARAEELVVVDQERRGASRAPLQSQLDLGAFAGLRADRRRAACALHPALDRLGDPAAVGRDGVAVEPAATIADEDRAAGVVRFGVHGDLVGRRRTWRRSPSLRALRARAARGRSRAAPDRRSRARSGRGRALRSRRRRLRARLRGWWRPGCRCRRASGGARVPAGARSSRRGRGRPRAAVRAPVSAAPSRGRAPRRPRARKADALGALGRELPEPRPEHEDQRAGDRARRDERAGRAEMAEQNDGADGRQHDRRDGQRAARPQRTAAGRCDRRAGQDERRADQRRPGHAERDEQGQRRRRRRDPVATIGRRPSECAQSAR